MISNGFKINNGSVSEQTENMKHFHINSPTSATTSVLFHLPTQTIVGPPQRVCSPVQGLVWTSNRSFLSLTLGCTLFMTCHDEQT